MGNLFLYRCVWGIPLALMTICVALLRCRAVTNCTAVARRVLVCIDTRLLVGDYAYVKRMGGSPLIESLCQLAMWVLLGTGISLVSLHNFANLACQFKCWTNPNVCVHCSFDPCTCVHVSSQYVIHQRPPLFLIASRSRGSWSASVGLHGRDSDTTDLLRSPPV